MKNLGKFNKHPRTNPTIFDRLKTKQSIKLNKGGFREQDARRNWFFGSYWGRPTKNKDRPE